MAYFFRMRRTIIIIDTQDNHTSNSMGPSSVIMFGPLPE